MICRSVCLAFFLGASLFVRVYGQEKKIDPKVASLIKALKGKTTTDRVKAAESLGKLGPEAHDATRAICETVLDRQQKVRNAALNALEKINPDLHQAVTPLVLDENFRNRLDALEQIKKMGEEGRPATPVVIASMNSLRPVFIGSEFKADLLIDTLMAIAPEDKEVVDALITWLLTELDATTIVRCAEVLPQTHSPKKAVPALLKSMSTRGGYSAAIQALGEIGPDAKAAVKPLANIILTNANPELRVAAITALRRIDPGAKEFLKALEKAKFDPDASVRKESEEALKVAQPKEEKKK